MESSNHKDLSIRSKKHARNTDYTAEDYEKLEQITSKWLPLSKCREIEETLGVKYKRGKLTKIEKDIIHRALLEYLKNVDMSLDEFKMKLLNRSRKSPRIMRNLFIYLAGALKTRPPMTLYLLVIRMYHPNKRLGEGWTKGQDATLQMLVELHGFDWTLIGTKMERTNMECRDRFRVIRERSKKGRWSPDEEQLLAKLVHEVFDTETNRLRPEMQHLNAPWTYISEKMKTRTMIQCFQKWSWSYPFKTRNSWKKEDDYRLCLMLYEQAFNDESEICWNDFSEPATSSTTLTHILKPDGVAPFIQEFSADKRNEGLFAQKSTFLSSRFRILKKRIPEYRSLSLDGILERLLANIKPLSEEFLSDSEL